MPFDAVVLDHHTGGIVGFTTQFIPGGALKENNATTRPFRLRWLHQLLSVVDDLNYRYGMIQQDIAPRNLLVDEKENLRLFDFNYSIMIEMYYTPERDDIKGIIFTLYEIITLDEHFRDVPHAEQDAEALLEMTWEKHPAVQLDADVQAFRDALESWVIERKAKEFFKPMETWLRWPEMPEPPAIAMPTYRDGKLAGTQMKSVRVVRPRELEDMGMPYFDWERPASYNLGEALAKNRMEKKETDGTESEGPQCMPGES